MKHFYLSSCACPRASLLDQQKSHVSVEVLHQHLQNLVNVVMTYSLFALQNLTRSCEIANLRNNLEHYVVFLHNQNLRKIF